MNNISFSIPFNDKSHALNMFKKKKSLLIYDLESESGINTYYMLDGFLKANRPPKISNEMKCTKNDMKYPGYEIELVCAKGMDHTKSGQGPAISTLDHSATTPKEESQLQIHEGLRGPSPFQPK